MQHINLMNKLMKLRLAYITATSEESRAIRTHRAQLKGQKQNSGVVACDRWSALLALAKSNQRALLKELGRK